MAHATSFIRRRRNLGALPFLVLMVLGKAAMKPPSLAAMVDLMGAGMSREALHQRFTQQAERFMDECLKWVLGRLRSTCLVQTPLLRIFKRVMIVDSTGWEVAEGLAQELPGSGGSSSAAGYKLQVCLEYLSGQVLFLSKPPVNGVWRRSWATIMLRRVSSSRAGGPRYRWTVAPAVCVADR
jgi:hypothetical protein